MLNFDVSDALLDDFFKAAPAPRLLSEVRWFLASLKQVDFYLRAANSAVLLKPDTMTRIEYAHPDTDKHQLAIAFARLFVEHEGIERFNHLRDDARQFGEQVYEGGWNEMIETDTLPEPISPSSPR